MLGRDVEMVKKINAQIKLTEMKNTISEMKSTLDGSNRLDVVEMDLCASCIRKKYDLCMVQVLQISLPLYYPLVSQAFHAILRILIHLPE